MIINPEIYSVRKITADDLSMTPAEYNRDGVQSVLVRDMDWMMFYVEGSDTPHYYFRKGAMDQVHWCGIVSPGKGEGPLTPQTSDHYRDMAQYTRLEMPYQKISDNPVVYQMRGNNPFIEKTFYEDHAVFKEGDFLDFRADYWPVCFFAHRGSRWNCDYVYQPFTLSGTYEGKKITGLGQFDRAYTDHGGWTPEEKRNSVSYCINSALLGIREDGRREIFYSIIHDNNQGKDPVYYWLEGEEPIVTEEISAETEFYRLPYNLPGDDTCTYKEVTYRFAGKVIHYKSIWGSRRYTDDPLHEPPGYTNNYGTWYEGDGNYRYKLMHTFNETTTATVSNLKKLGYVVHE